ncbi:MAG: M15 family peptidase [Planctomycetes bacterium]|nr:M15 family peptidase [Planctomycetota bacterium]
MKLSEAQHEFGRCVAAFLPIAYKWAEAYGHRITLGELFIPPACKPGYRSLGGISNSLHFKKLAIHLYVLVHGQKLGEFNDYIELGEMWELLHERATWGGRFPHRDAVHFSFTYNGVK